MKKNLLNIYAKFSVQNPWKTKLIYTLAIP